MSELETVRSTIFALSTAPGRAGIAVIRVSGAGARVALEQMAGGLPSPRQASYRLLRARPGGEVLDDALVLWLPAPRSETGEDMAELQCHGSRAVVSALLDALAALPGFRMAEPGEFARRAFLNGKLDLTAVEGLADLIDAETDAQRRQALGQARGGLARLYDGWRQQLLEAMALVEAAIDFSDEADVSARAVGDAMVVVTRLEAELARHRAGANRGEIIRSGFRVTLAGAPNAGKSSLLNALARRDVAIVSEEAGTTRDVIETRLDIEGLVVILSDTAGLRPAESAVEREGIRRTLATAGEADLVLWVLDATMPLPEPPSELAFAIAGGRLWPVASKCDMARPQPMNWAGLPAPLQVSAVTGEGLELLTANLAAHVRQLSAAATGEDVVPTNARHRAGLGQASGHLARFLAEPDGPVELRAEDLRLAADELGRLTGRIDPEEVLGRIFSRFCIGK